MHERERTPSPSRAVSRRPTGPAFYALSGGGWRDWWTLLHPPYTAWNLSYVALGAALATPFDVWRLVAEEGAFFLGLGVGAHALDELKGRPLRTRIPDGVLIGAAVVALAGAAVLGLAGITQIGPVLVAFIAAGLFLVLAYNLEWFGGGLHTNIGFSAAWGAFPVLAGYFAQAETLSLASALVAGAAFALSFAQRSLSTPARRLRRRVAEVEGIMTLNDGVTEPLDKGDLLRPLDAALNAMSWGMMALAAGAVTTRMLG